MEHLYLQGILLRLDAQVNAGTCLRIACVQWYPILIYFQPLPPRGKAHLCQLAPNSMCLVGLYLTHGYYGQRTFTVIKGRVLRMKVYLRTWDRVNGIGRLEANLRKEEKMTD